MVPLKEFRDKPQNFISGSVNDNNGGINLRKWCFDGSESVNHSAPKWQFLQGTKTAFIKAQSLCETHQRGPPPAFTITVSRGLCRWHRCIQGPGELQETAASSAQQEANGQWMACVHVCGSYQVSVHEGHLSMRGNYRIILGINKGEMKRITLPLCQHLLLHMNPSLPDLIAHPNAAGSVASSPALNGFYYSYSED